MSGSTESVSKQPTQLNVELNSLFRKKSYNDAFIVEYSERIQNFQENIWPICRYQKDRWNA